MKPESLLESDPINMYLARKPKMPFKSLDEVANGNYGLVISGYSLVGNTEPQLFPYSKSCYSEIQPNSGKFYPFPVFWVTLLPFPGVPYLKVVSPQATPGRCIRKRSQENSFFILYPSFFSTKVACYSEERNK